MKNSCKTVAFTLCLLLLFPCALTGCARTPKGGAGSYYCTFTDSTGQSVTLPQAPVRVAVLFSSLAELWCAAGGTLAVTVGETVERGIAGENVILVDGGAGKTVDSEALLASAPDFVITSADIPAQAECAALLRTAGIPVAELRLESFADYLAALQICTDITGRADLFETLGSAQKSRIDAAIATAPFAGKKILFIRAGSTARSVKAKCSADHFAAAMLHDLGGTNIADGAPLLADSLSMEVILSENPDYIFFTAMGDEAASRAYVERMLTEETWQSLTAVQNGKWMYLAKDLFHFKPIGHYAEAYETLAAAAEDAA